MSQVPVQWLFYLTVVQSVKNVRFGGVRVGGKRCMYVNIWFNKFFPTNITPS